MPHIGGGGWRRREELEREGFLLRKQLSVIIHVAVQSTT